MPDKIKNRFYTLDGMRGVAAIMVMFYHYYWDLHLRFLKNTFLAVDFFFILSGFVIYHAYREKLIDNAGIRKYIASRIARLYPMTAIGVFLGFWVLYLHAHGSADFAYDRRDIFSSAISNLGLLPYFPQKDMGGGLSR